jgi:hypothetical protein
MGGMAVALAQGCALFGAEQPLGPDCPVPGMTLPPGARFESQLSTSYMLNVSYPGGTKELINHLETSLTALDYHTVGAENRTCHFDYMAERDSGLITTVVQLTDHSGYRGGGCPYSIFIGRDVALASPRHTGQPLQGALGDRSDSSWPEPGQFLPQAADYNVEFTSQTYNVYVKYSPGLDAFVKYLEGSLAPLGYQCTPNSPIQASESSSRAAGFASSTGLPDIIVADCDYMPPQSNTAWNITICMMSSTYPANQQLAAQQQKSAKE